LIFLEWLSEIPLSLQAATVPTERYPVSE
jgi:hypothetical protein